MRLRTIGLISSLALGLLAASLPAEAQQAGKVYRGAAAVLLIVGLAATLAMRRPSEPLI